MSLHAEIARIDPDIAVVHVSGGMTSDDAGPLTSLVQVLLDRGEKKIILELAAVQTIDSLGGTSVIRCFFAARERGAHLCIAGASPAVETLFGDTRVNTLIAFLETLTAACEHLASPANAGGRTA